jgi:hypothetical protein
MEKPSVYLVQKTDALREALEFFIADSPNRHKTAEEKRLAFLAQIDFWDWEIENLIYSYLGFVERQRVWASQSGLKEALGKNGMCVKARLLEKIRWSTFLDDYSYKRTSRVVAPCQLLNETIDKWNHLLTLIEKNCYDKAAKNYVKLGAQINADLSYRSVKTPILRTRKTAKQPFRVGDESDQ